ncbi:MAG: ABC transporter permease [Bryobacteraceae bacterium]
MESLLKDFRYSFRQLRKSPSFTLTAILSLALGIGATTAVFSVVYAVLVNPYPYKDSNRMIHLVLEQKGGGEYWVGLTGPQYRVIRKAAAVESASAEDQWNLSTTGQDLPEDVSATYFTGNAFDHFGVPVLMGRSLTPGDAPDGGDPQPVAVLGSAFWMRHYGGSQDVIGKTLQLAHKNYTVVGVTPARFTWADADVYLPFKPSEDATHTYNVSVRLKPGVTRTAANSEFQALFVQFAKETPKHFPEGGFKTNIQGLNDNFVHRIGPTLYLLFGGVALLLVIGCANVSILMLARGTARQHELAVRAAIGGSRYRIVRQLLTESLALSITGALLGLALAYKATGFIAAWLPEYSFPHEAAIRMNVPVLLFSIALAVATGVLFGLSPAIQLSRTDLARVMQANMRKMTTGVKGRRMHGILVASQIALTLLLLTAAGAAMGGFLRMMGATLGYDPHHVMSVGVPIHDNTLKTWEERTAYFELLKDKIAAMPEVVSTGISTNATPPDNGWKTKFELLGRPAAIKQEARLNLISPEYFPLLRIPLVQGRLFDQAETVRGAHVAVINQTMAKQYWPNGDALGHELRVPELKAEPPYLLTAKGADEWLQVVGVVADARDDGLQKPIKPAVYIPYTIGMGMSTQILVRTKVEPLTMLRAIRAQVQAVNPDQQVFRDIRNLEQWITRLPEWSQQRLVATLFGAFSFLGLALAAVGLYSVVSYSVAQRTGEFGIRMALGAERRDVLGLVFRSMAVTVGGGLTAGILLSFALNQVLAKWAEGSSRDPLILIGVVVLLSIISGIACLVPARRASSIDPIQALRYE